MSTAVILQFGTKFVATCGLVFLTILCSIEIWRLWSDRTLLLVGFEYVREGESVPESGEDFARLVDSDLWSLTEIYTGNEIVVASAGQTAAANDFIVDAEIRSSPRWSKTNDMKWPRFHATQESDASFELACRIFRRTPGVAAELLMTSDDEFCSFSRVLRSYERYREMALNPWSKKDSEKALDELDQKATELGDRDDVSPYAYKLVAYIWRDKGKKAEAKTAIDKYQAGLRKVRREDKEAEKFVVDLGETAASARWR